MTLVKICGITRIEDALDAAALGASAIGLVFWPASPRAIDPISAQAIVDALPPLVTVVGVFVDQPEAEVDRIAGEIRLGAIQLHGRETPEYCARVRRPVIKSFGVDASFDEAALEPYPAGITVLLDAKDEEKRGGTGQRIDWTIAARVAAKRRIVLAGGVDARNVEEAIRTVQPFAIDVSSGVERAPGLKDPAKMQALFEAVKRC